MSFLPVHSPPRLGLVPSICTEDRRVPGWKLTVMKFAGSLGVVVNVSGCNKGAGVGLSLAGNLLICCRAW